MATYRVSNIMARETLRVRSNSTVYFILSLSLSFTLEQSLPKELGSHGSIQRPAASMEASTAPSNGASERPATAPSRSRFEHDNDESVKRRMLVRTRKTLT